jgi:hypothetical protein
VSLSRRRRARLARTALILAALLGLGRLLTGHSDLPQALPAIAHQLHPAPPPPFAGRLIVEGIAGFSAAEVSTIGRAAHQRPLPVSVGELYVLHGLAPYDQIPLATAVADPASYAVAVGKPEVLAMLVSGAVVSTSAAELFGLEAGRTLHVPAGRNVRVTAVLPDELLGGYELLVRRGAEPSLPTRAAYVVLRAPDVREVESAVSAALPDRRLRFTQPADPGYFSPSGDVLSQSQVSQRFGAFPVKRGDSGFTPDPAWVKDYIVEVRVPLLGPVTCNRRIVSELVAAMTDLQRQGLASVVDRQDFQAEGGCWNPRVARFQEGSLSHHAWGIALDINVARNPLGAKPVQDPRLVAAMERHGFTWGGRWLRHDGAHFEWLGKDR